MRYSGRLEMSMKATNIYVVNKEGTRVFESRLE